MTDPDTLAAIAVELAVRVRDDEPQTNGRWLQSQLPDPGDWFRLAFVLAAAVPDDRPWLHLTAWTQICPLTASIHRHRGQKPCPNCLNKQADRKRELRNRRAA